MASSSAAPTTSNKKTMEQKFKEDGAGVSKVIWQSVNELRDTCKEDAETWNDLNQASADLHYAVTRVWNGNEPTLMLQNCGHAANNIKLGVKKIKELLAQETPDAEQIKKKLNQIKASAAAIKNQVVSQNEKEPDPKTVFKNGDFTSDVTDEYL